jgi:phosphate transport system substrate-binding protein
MCDVQKLIIEAMKSYLYAVSAILSAITLAGCGGSAATKVPTGPVVLKGAGATAPYLAYSKWIEEYKKVDPGVQIQYQATGSGDGIKQLQAGAVDFAASDIPLTDQEVAGMSVKPLHFPALVGAIVPVYNLSGVKDNLQFTGDALAGIFSGKIKTWNDPAIAKANPGAGLPGTRIKIVHRSDVSGSTYALTDFLSLVNAPWKASIGKGGTVTWPGGEGAVGNEALAELVKKTPDSIGYVELNYAKTQGLRYGAVQNAAGKFQMPDIEALGSAEDVAQEMKDDFRGSIANSPAKNAYPISTLTWLLVPSKIADDAKRKAMREFLEWAYGPGQKIANSLDYDELQAPLIDRVRAQVKDIH